MLSQRGYTGSIVQIRRVIQLCPVRREAFLRLTHFEKDQFSLHLETRELAQHGGGGRSLRGEDEFCVEDDISDAIRAVTGVIFGAHLLGRLIS
jgi:hypothetical protein